MKRTVTLVVGLVFSLGAVETASVDAMLCNTYSTEWDMEMNKYTKALCDGQTIVHYRNGVEVLRRPFLTN